MEDDSQAIVEAKKVFQDSEILPQLAIIKANFTVLVHTITAMEERQFLVKSVERVERLQASLTLQPFAGKLEEVLQKNPGFEKMRKIPNVLRGSESDFSGEDANDIAMMTNAPIVTCNVERCFSSLRDVNTPKRGRLTVEHIKDILVIQWNRKIDLDC